MSEFNELWDFVVKRGCTIVQERSELEFAFNLMKGCESYLEIGTAEGNSLYVLAHALKKGAKITCIDLGENHTIPMHNEIIQKLKPDYEVAMYHGDSTERDTYPQKEKHDVVLIDGGHDYHTVLSDCKMYVPLAKKYVLFHDIKLPDVTLAVSRFIAEHNPGNWKYSEFVNTPNMGFAILEVK